MNYKEELICAMGMLAQHEKTVFVGQSVRYGGQAMYPTLRDVPMEKRIEMPVVEDFQMGFCTGLALEGFIPVCIFPRIDFMLLAANQLVNHLDKIPMMGGYRPKVIIRTAVGSRSPMNPGPQHTQDHTQAFYKMLHTVEVVTVPRAEVVMPSYLFAMDHGRSVIIVEHMDKYYE
jgi:pyruvate/2-oxoglutarate/acetoin dehydrogenase E1 component